MSIDEHRRARSPLYRGTLGSRFSFPSGRVMPTELPDLGRAQPAPGDACRRRRRGQLTTQMGCGVLREGAGAEERESGGAEEQT